MVVVVVVVVVIVVVAIACLSSILADVAIGCFFARKTDDKRRFFS